MPRLYPSQEPAKPEGTLLGREEGQVLRHHRGGLLPGDDPEGRRLSYLRLCGSGRCQASPCEPSPSGGKGLSGPDCFAQPRETVTPLSQEAAQESRSVEGVIQGEGPLQPCNSRARVSTWRRTPRRAVGVEQIFTLSPPLPMVAPKGKRERALSRALLARILISFKPCGEGSPRPFPVNPGSPPGFQLPRSG